MRALARAEGVEAALLDEWARSQPDLAERSDRAAAANGPKGWRFGGELHEIGVAFADCGLPSGFGQAAAEIFDRFAPLRDAHVDLEAVLATLR